MKMYKMIHYPWMHTLYQLHYEGEGDPPKDPPKDPPADPPADPPGGDKTYTKAELDQILQTERRKHADTTKRQVEQLEKLQQNSSLTAKEKADLETQIDGLRDQLMTKEQIAAKEKEKATKKHTEELNQVSSERDTWQKRFEDSTIINSITKAAVEAEAFDVDQIIALIKNKSPRLVEDQNEAGEALGTFTPKVKLPSVGKDGKAVELDLTIAEAVKSMKEDEKHFNLFKSTAKSGLGMGGNQGTGNMNDRPPSDPAQYREWRKKQNLKRKA